MNLHYKKYGEGVPLLILHGLFGSLDNWATLGKKLSKYFTVYLIDQRNHGHSPHNHVFDYDVMSADIEQLIKKEGLDEVNLIGHSMGGKAAMFFSVYNPDKVKKLIVVDIAPKEYPVTHDGLIDALQSLNLSEIQDRGEADDQLSKKISDYATRQFLLKSLHWKKEGNEEKLKWRFNLDAIEKNLENIGKPLPHNAIFNGETLFINGKNSDYITTADENLIHHHFPHSVIKTITEAGHWVHAEKPDEFLEIILEFLKG